MLPDVAFDLKHWEVGGLMLRFRMRSARSRHRAVLLIDLSHSPLVLLRHVGFRLSVSGILEEGHEHGKRTSSSSREILLLISVSEGPFAPEDRVEPGKDQRSPLGPLMSSILFRFICRLAGGSAGLCGKRSCSWASTWCSD